MDLTRSASPSGLPTGAISSAPGPSTMGAFVPALDPQTEGDFALPLDTHRPGFRSHGPRQGLPPPWNPYRFCSRSLAARL